MSPADLTAELEQLHAAAFGWALKLLWLGSDRAEDVLQASYLKLLDAARASKGRSSFRTFVLGVIARTAREARRRSALRRWLPLASLVLGPESGGRPPDLCDGARPGRGYDPAGARTRAAVGAPAQVLHLVFYEDLTIAEAAAVAGISVGTARTPLRARQGRAQEAAGEKNKK